MKLELPKYDFKEFKVNTHVLTMLNRAGINLRISNLAQDWISIGSSGAEAERKSCNTAYKPRKYKVKKKNSNPVKIA